jgi:hypothetical protein
LKQIILIIEENVGVNEAVGLGKVVPFLLEDELKKLGAHYSKGADGGSHAEQDGLLISGWNPASSKAVTRLHLKTLIVENYLFINLQQT